MPKHLAIEILPQPNDSTCGPTSLHAVYRYYGDQVSLDEVIASVSQFDSGGTFAGLLGIDALRRGYRATLYTYDLRMFDPSWFGPRPKDLSAKLSAQREAKPGDARFLLATDSYLEFLRLGGQIRFEDLTPALLRKHLKAGEPILTGLSATHLYRAPRELDGKDDDLRGEPVGHFVVLAGYNPLRRKVRVADPLLDNPSGTHEYDVTMQHAVAAIYLGIVTYDANLLVISPAHAPQ